MEIRDLSIWADIIDSYNLDYSRLDSVSRLLSDEQAVIDMEYLYRLGEHEEIQREEEFQKEQFYLPTDEEEEIRLALYNS